MSGRIAIKESAVDEAISTMDEEHTQLLSDTTSTLLIVRNESVASVNDSDFAANFAVTADALKKKSYNFICEIKNYSDAITNAKAELTGADKKVKSGISGSVSGH